MISRRLLLSFTLSLVAATTARPQTAGPFPIDNEWAAKWREDLAFASERMPETHLRIDHATPLDEIQAAIDDLATRIPQLAHHEAVVELTRIVAMIGDGHTRLTQPIDPAAGIVGGHTETLDAGLPGAPFHHYPIRFHLYKDGLAVERIALGHGDLLGSRVVRIGSMSTNDAVAAVDPLIHRDNATQARQLLPRFLVVPEVLHATGIIDALGPVTLELQTPAGALRRLTLDPAPTGADTVWVDYSEERTPLFRRDLERNYRFEYLEDASAVYFRYFRVQSQEGGESLADFADRMFTFIEENNVERLIVDLRGNDGGNNWLNAPLERGVIRAKPLWRPGGLVVFADRGTFSAAMNFASFLANTTPAVFVGEATGGRPNHYGDARKLVLPNTGLTIRLSTVYHQDSGASDDRPQIDPHVPVPLTAAAIRDGRDPVLEEIAGWQLPGDPAASWSGPLTVRQYASTASVELARNGSGWSGTFAAAGLVETTPIQSVTQTEGEIRFEVPIESSTLRVRAVATEERLIGMLDYQGQWYPFVANRSESPRTD